MYAPHPQQQSHSPNPRSHLTHALTHAYTTLPASVCYIASPLSATPHTCPFECVPKLRRATALRSSALDCNTCIYMLNQHGLVCLYETRRAMGCWRERASERAAAATASTAAAVCRCVLRVSNVEIA